jgi:hypothetical protein
MPSRQADGDGDPAGEGLDVPLGLVEAGPDGDPPLGLVDPLPPVGLAGEPVLGWAEGLVDGFLPPVVARGLVAPVAAAPGPAAPPAGADVRDAPSDGVRPAAGAPVVAVPTVDWLAAGVSLNTPETSRAVRPAHAATVAPTASTPTRLRWFPCGWPG